MVISPERGTVRPYAKADRIRLIGWLRRFSRCQPVSRIRGCRHSRVSSSS